MHKTTKSNFSNGIFTLQGYRPYIKPRGEDLSERGRVPGRPNSSLMVTEIARGSFGFVLEEPDVSVELINSALKDAVSNINHLIHSIGTKDLDDMEEEAEILDSRLLLSAREFFRLLDDANATMRIETSLRQVLLSREKIEAGRNRIDAMEWEERDITVDGVLFIVPDSQRFDLEPTKTQPTIHGKISQECLIALRAKNDTLLHQVLGQRVRARLIEKEVRSERDQRKPSYTLKAMELITE